MAEQRMDSNGQTGKPLVIPADGFLKKDEDGGMSGMRLCIDLREMNKLLKDVHNPLPKLQKIMMGLHGSGNSTKQIQRAVGCQSPFSRRKNLSAGAKLKIIFRHRSD
jgi:hypothetical protein